ncbi:MAG: substrate-binding domain-containing protein [Bacteroidota bacterium]|nr:substrate-binding domain-containing protein [Bacteroidota bacterium]
MLPNLEDARYMKDRDYFSAEVKQLGGVVEFGNASNDPNVQLKQSMEMIERGAKVLVITAVNQNLAASIVRFAHDKGVKVIAYERLIQNCDLDYLIGFDHREVGRLQASYAIKHKPSGNYVIIGGDKTDKNAELIKEGQMEIIKPLVDSGKIRILYSTYVEDWSEENAYKDVCSVINLSGEKIDAVLASNDGMAGGVIKSLEENKMISSVVTTGLDADLAACRRIINGQQSMTVFKSFKNEAKIAAQLAVKLASGKDVTHCKSGSFNGKLDVPTVFLKPILVDFSNVKSTLSEEGGVQL